MSFRRRAARWRHACPVGAAVDREEPTCHMRLPLPLVVLLIATRLTAQAPAGQTPGPKPSDPAPVTLTAEQDHQHMMSQLGIRRLRPGPSGDESAPNHANYDEARANPYPILPELLTTRGGDRVTTPAAWWTRRRPELVEALEREVYGRVPAQVPRVSWTVTVTDREFVGFTPVVARRLVGHVDNRAYPAIAVDIAMTVVVPANARGPVPLLIMFGRSALPAPAQPSPEALEKINSALKQLLVARDSSLRSVFEQYPAYDPVGRMAAAPPSFGAPPATAGGDPPPTQQLIAAGWGYALLDPTSVQADNGAGLTRGIIGLVNRGQPRRPDDWGALRAWAWGAGRALDYFETDSTVDARRVGIEGVSRYGKAALVTLAFDQRFAVGLIGSSGKGGATLHRRVWGEAVESLASRWRVPLDGRQLSQVRIGRGVVRKPRRRGTPGGRARADRALRAAPHVHQLRRSRARRCQVARPEGELHGHHRRRLRFQAARGA